MTCLISKVDQVKNKLKAFHEFKRDTDSYSTFLAYNIDNFFREYPNFDVWLYSLLQADLEARLDELNKDINDEKNH